jgi:hypothetical protein
LGRAVSGASQSTAEELFAQLVERFAGTDGVMLPGEPGSPGFGSNALRVRGAIFAMLVRGHLVVKLPRDRVDALADSAAAERFDANRARPMKEWALLLTDDPVAWAELAEEALQFVRAIADARQK